MKKMTCRALGGPCDAEFTGDSFQEIGEKSHDHVMAEINKGDAAHRAAAEKMRNATPDELKAMMETFQRRYDDAPEV